MDRDEFDEVRAEPDALRLARRATDLIGLYQQRSIELARLRKQAIERAADERGMTMTAVAAEIGLSKGRITQIRQSAPPLERVLFGVGPITVAVPQRAMPDRSLPVISAEDSLTAERMTELLDTLGFQVQQYRIPVGGDWSPSGDVVAICGPKSSHVTAEAIAQDPALSFEPDDAGRWVIRDRKTGAGYESGLDETPRTNRDMAYLARLPHGDGSLLVVAGVHAIGSLGAVHYLAGHAREIYDQVGEGCWSTVIASTHDAETILTSELACPLHRH